MRNEKFKTEYLEVLAQFGLKPQEAVVFLACLELGEVGVGQLARATGIQRTFIYDIVKDLVAKGILSQVETGKIQRYSAITIDQFKKLQLEKVREFEEIIPELRALSATMGEEPKVRFLRGKEGLLSAYADILENVRNTEILAYATGEGFYEDEPEIQDNYIKNRTKQNIRVRAIAADLPETRRFTERDKEQLRETRLVPADAFPFANEIDIYADKVAIMSLVKGEYLAVIIQSEPIARTQKAIFELAWRGAQNFQKPGMDSESN